MKQAVVSIQTQDFDVGDELKLIDECFDHVGAVVSFVGKVRGNDHHQQLHHLWLTHFPVTTETAIQHIIQSATQQWKLLYAKVIHRVGVVGVGEQIVLVLTASAHREDAYQANCFIMDYLKTEAPLWKKECFIDGREIWVDMKDTDLARVQSWKKTHAS